MDLFKVKMQKSSCHKFCVKLFFQPIGLIESTAVEVCNPHNCMFAENSRKQTQKQLAWDTNNIIWVLIFQTFSVELFPTFFSALHWFKVLLSSFFSPARHIS